MAWPPPYPSGPLSPPPSHGKEFTSYAVFVLHTLENFGNLSTYNLLSLTTSSLLDSSSSFHGLPLCLATEILPNPKLTHELCNFSRRRSTENCISILFKFHFQCQYFFYIYINKKP
ncbi:protein farnesyltransferase subunit beta [Iris pallida]|uniref:Protein farnesyltransferase subunit beta n=1 Tax=Iris pallida TaxID=29817 RepID=A0AAX6GVK3_IRIPA|nr:protein farnesyltransferase subunit beta [Iris pallida]